MMPRSKNKVVDLLEHVFAYGLMTVISGGLFVSLIVKPLLLAFHIDILH